MVVTEVEVCKIRFELEDSSKIKNLMSQIIYYES